MITKRLEFRRLFCPACGMANIADLELLIGCFRELSALVGVAEEVMLNIMS